MNLTDLLARAWVHAIVTVNDDYTDQVTETRRLTRAARFLPRAIRTRLERVKRVPMALLCQETKSSDLRAELPEQFGVRQYLDSDATAGVAVVWDTEQAHALEGDGHAGWAPLVRPHGERMEVRGVVWQDVEVGEVGSGRIVRLAAAHRPPLRYDHLWPSFDRALRTWASESPYPILLGIDGNTTDLAGLRKRLRFRFVRGHRIDTVLGKGRGIRPVSRAVALAKGRSDHNPIRTLWRIGRTRTPAEHRAEVAP